MTKYYYCTNGDGTTHNGFRPFAGGPVAIAPDWIPDDRECGNALHCCAHNPLRCLGYVTRENPVIHEVEPVDARPEKGGKIRARQLIDRGVVDITEAMLLRGAEDANAGVRRAAMQHPNYPRK